MLTSWKANIKIRTRNVMNLTNPGTIILPETNLQDRKLILAKSISKEKHSRPTAVAVKNNILILNIYSNRRALSHGFFAQIFAILDRWQLSVDLISTFEVNISITLHSLPALLNSGSNKEALDKSLTGVIEELAQHGVVNVKRGLAIVSLVGKGMIRMDGMAGRIFSVLDDHHINIEMILLRNVMRNAPLTSSILIFLPITTSESWR